jgi:dTDP-4-dehydrorhamnose 3,5-epimerase
VRFTPTDLNEVLIVEPDVHRDDRGFFLEVFHARKYFDAGIRVNFVQDNQSRSVQGTLRGLHAQRRHPQAKLVRALEGAIFDVAVDVRRGSPSFGRWVGVELSAENFRQLFVPVGFIHGFLVLSECAQVEYKVSDYYDPTDEYGVIWNDPDLAIHWPIEQPMLSDKDRALPKLAEIRERLPIYRGGVGEL